jgi:hypothetical protein
LTTGSDKTYQILRISGNTGRKEARKGRKTEVNKYVIVESPNDFPCQKASRTFQEIITSPHSPDETTVYNQELFVRGEKSEN